MSHKIAGATVLDSRQSLRQRFVQTRAATLALFEGIDFATFCRQAHPDYSPIGWHLGHIGYTEALWLLKGGGLADVAAHRELARIFAVDALPKERRSTALPSIDQVRAYLQALRLRVLDRLEKPLSVEQERLWRFVVQHECQHGETVAWILQLQRAIPAVDLPRERLPSEMLRIEAGSFLRGSDAADALDNERPAHRSWLPDFWIDRYPVTQAQYADFLEAGGYRERRWWSEQGWQWLSSARVDRPLYWSGPDNRPVLGVSWYEAQAYARFVDKRLPTEAEWEKAASWHPIEQKQRIYPWGDSKPTGERYNVQGEFVTDVDRYPTGLSAYGCYDMLGNGWEWTDTWFHPYAGFESYPYHGYSAAYFDETHRVLKGGSHATQPLVGRCSFRNWYEPGQRVPFAGLRCARS